MYSMLSSVVLAFSCQLHVIIALAQLLKNWMVFDQTPTFLLWVINVDNNFDHIPQAVCFVLVFCVFQPYSVPGKTVLVMLVLCRQIGFSRVLF